MPDELDLRPFFRSFRRHWHWILIVTVAGTVAGFAVARQLPPVFKAETLIQVRQDQNGFISSGSTNPLDDLVALAGLGQTNSDRALVIATLKSRALIQGFIEKNGLLPSLFSDQWDSATGSWLENPGPTSWHGYNYFIGNVMTVTEDRKTGLIKVAIEWHTPEQAAALANDLVATANSQLKERAIAEGEARLEYLKTQAATLGYLELKGAAYNLIETELKRLMLARAGEEYVLRTIDKAQAPQAPSEPNILRLTLASFLLSLLVAASACFMFDRTLFQPESGIAAAAGK